MKGSTAGDSYESSCRSWYGNVVFTFLCVQHLGTLKEWWIRPNIFQFLGLMLVCKFWIRPLFPLQTSWLEADTTYSEPFFIVLSLMRKTDTVLESRKSRAFKQKHLLFLSMVAFCSLYCFINKYVLFFSRLYLQFSFLSA